MGVDEARLFVNIFAAAALGFAIAGAFPIYASAVVGARVIIIGSNLAVWGIDKLTDFSNKLVNEVVEAFDE